MSKRSPDLLLEDMLEALTKAMRYTQGMHFDAFRSDDKTVDAVVRNLEIVGEAARRLPEQYKDNHPEIPWWRMAGMRNRIVHDYFGVDLSIVWHVISSDAPKLVEDLRRLTQS